MRAVLISSLLVAGCASNSGVVNIGPDTYMIAKQAATGFPGLGNMKAEIITEGSAFCRTNGRVFRITSATETQPPYIAGNYPRSEIEFMCLDKSDPELTRPRIKRDPSAVIEVVKP